LWVLVCQSVCSHPPLPSNPPMARLPSSYHLHHNRWSDQVREEVLT
jgi:hypothetical protein